MYYDLSMSLLSAIKNSKDDIWKPDTKSYWGYDFRISLVDADTIRNKKDPSQTEKRMLSFDLSEQEHAESIIVLNSKYHVSNEQHLNSKQITDILDDIGFNVRPTLTPKHNGDFAAIMNVGGFSIPGWVKFARRISKFLPSREKLLLTKLSPGNDRLHVIVFQEIDGSWIFTAHTDYNWLNLNIPKIYKAHVGHGAGDFITGTLMLYGQLKSFQEKVK